MAVKHIKEYYLQVCDDYKELLDELKDWEVELSNKMVSPEQVEEFKKMIEPVKNNFQTLSYVIYLLNKPQREDKKKQSKYERQHRKDIQFIDEKFTKDGVLKQDRDILDRLKVGV